MESGRNKLLTIAIPTWNRAEKLEKSLNCLLPQIMNFEDKIEFIISDNASTDNTSNKIENVKNKYPKFNFIYNQQQENTGFFGNFFKCISLGTGKYFWLLSDDDFLFPNVINKLLEILERKEVGAVFLDGWTDDKDKIQEFNVEFVNKFIFFSDNPYRHSLISSVIFRNNIQKNDSIFISLKDNALIAYAVFLKAISEFDNFAIIKGSSLLVRNDHNVRFNALKIFITDLNEISNYVKQIYSKKIRYKIINSFLKYNISYHFRDYKYYNKYKDFEISNKELFILYYKFLNFWIYILPIIILKKKFFLELKKNYHVYFKKK